MLVLVDVGEDGKAERLPDFGEDRHRLAQSNAAPALQRRAIGLIERGLVDDADAKPVGDFAQGGGHCERVIAALERTWTGDEGQRQMIAENDGVSAIADPDFLMRLHN